MEVSRCRPGGARGSRAAGAPGRMEPTPARALAVFSSHKLMSVRVEPVMRVLRAASTLIGPVWPGSLLSLSEGCGGKGEGLAG